MEFNIATIIITIINFSILCGIIFFAYRFIKYRTNQKKRSANLERKLDRILELLEKGGKE